MFVLLRLPIVAVSSCSLPPRLIATFTDWSGDSLRNETIEFANAGNVFSVKPQDDVVFAQAGFLGRTVFDRSESRRRRAPGSCDSGSCFRG